MRVIAGKSRGRRVKASRGLALRPTSDRVKEALFNILPRDFSGYSVLDLFAGTGNLSIEALSRGAARALLVDASPQAGKLTRENLRNLGYADRSSVWVTPVFRAIRALSRKRESFDLVFVDPPYEKGWVGRSLKAIAEHGLLRDTGILVIEHSVREAVAEACGALALRDQRRYGVTVLSFFGYAPVQTS